MITKSRMTILSKNKQVTSVQEETTQQRKCTLLGLKTLNTKITIGNCQAAITKAIEKVSDSSLTSSKLVAPFEYNKSVRK